MKTKFFCLKVSKTIIIFSIIILFQIIFIIYQIKQLREIDSFKEIEKISNTISKEIEKDDTQNKISNNIMPNNEQTNTQYNTQNNLQNAIQNNIDESQIQNTKLEEYKNMPSNLKGYKIIGKLEIPKINLNTYILEETSNKSLKVSVTKLCGPEVNKEGNLCIAGHNYRNMKMFGGIKKLEIGDKITVTDTFDRSLTYEVYNKYEANPKDVSCLNQDTAGEREITLITCTAGAIKRVIVKAVEVYD